MRRLKNKSITPPGPKHFSYTHAETGHTSEARDYWTWNLRIKEHRKANNLPPITEAQAEDQLCATLDPSWCDYEREGNQSFVSTRLGLHQVIDATKALLASALGNYVPQEEAERRAKICSACYLNVQAEGCGACARIANYIAPGKTTTNDQYLKNCALCGCYNRAQVHFELTTLSGHTNSNFQSNAPSFCWQKVNGDNYRV